MKKRNRSSDPDIIILDGTSPRDIVDYLRNVRVGEMRLAEIFYMI
jgi:hypothetical protein